MRVMGWVFALGVALSLPLQTAQAADRSWEQEIYRGIYVESTNPKEDRSHDPQEGDNPSCEQSSSGPSKSASSNSDVGAALARGWWEAFFELLRAWFAFR